MKKKKTISIILIIAVLISLLILLVNIKLQRNMESKAYVPDEKTAIKIAETKWLEMYGDKINEEKPFVATLDGNTWIVKGTLPKEKIGGVAEIKINKNDGKILSIGHKK